MSTSRTPSKRSAASRTRRVLMLFGFLALLCGMPGAAGQETRLNQKKIERERARKKKAAEREYQQAVKRHRQNQTKETRSRMKQSQKEARKVTPIGR